MNEQQFMKWKLEVGNQEYNGWFELIPNKI